MALGPLEAATTAAKQQAEALPREDIPRTKRHLSKAQTTNQHPCAVPFSGDSQRQQAVRNNRGMFNKAGASDIGPRPPLGSNHSICYQKPSLPICARQSREGLTSHLPETWKPHY